MSPPARPGYLRVDEHLKWKDVFITYYEVEKGGMLDFGEFYVYMHEWFGEHDLNSWQDDKDQIEDFYLQRERADGATENVIWWRAVKRVGQNFTYFCKMDWQNFGSKKTETMYGEQKVKVDKIGLVIRVWWWLQIDPENRWERSYLGRHFQGFTRWFFQRFYRQEVQDHRDKLLLFARKQEDDIKHYLEMPTYRPHERTFYPEAGYKWQRAKPKPEDFEHARRRGDMPVN
jgi:hypothetical protein